MRKTDGGNGDGSAVVDMGEFELQIDTDITVHYNIDSRPHGSFESCIHNHNFIPTLGKVNKSIVSAVI